MQLTAKQNQINRKCMIIQAQITQAEIAQKLSINPENQRITRQAVNNELRGEYKSEYVRLGICRIIGIPKEIFWPEFYGPEAENNDNAQVNEINELDKVVNS